MREFKVGDRVRLVKKQTYKGDTHEHLKLDEVGEVTYLGIAHGSLGTLAPFHVKVLMDDGREDWTQIDTLEWEENIDDEQYQAALASIGVRERELTFEEIVFRDTNGNKFILRPTRNNSVELTNEKGEFLVELDRRYWTNTAGLIELALKAAEDV